MTTHEGKYLNNNGKLVKAGEPLISADNRSFRYGDGCFETMHYHDGKVLLAESHFERLFFSLEKMYFKLSKKFTPVSIYEQVHELVKANGHQQRARVRLTIHRGNGGLYDEHDAAPQFLIQSWALGKQLNLNQNGLNVGIYKLSRKQVDFFSSFKTNNYQPYLLAALWAKQEKLNDALVLNTNDRIADATIANVFVVKDGVIQTPSLDEGCVGGIMRKHLLRYCKAEGYKIEEAIITEEHLRGASELFLSNAISGIRWVRSLGNDHFKNDVSSLLYKKFVQPLFND